jgi:hypothetical protein
MNGIKVTRCDLNQVLSKPEYYNVNNADPRPEDYNANLKRFHTCSWIEQFHGTSVPVITLDINDIRWMKKAAETVGVITGRFSHLFDDNLEETYQKHVNSVPVCPPEGWFIRCDRVSLKGGMYVLCTVAFVTQTKRPFQVWNRALSRSEEHTQILGNFQSWARMYYNSVRLSGFQLTRFLIRV